MTDITKILNSLNPHNDSMKQVLLQKRKLRQGEFQSFGQDAQQVRSKHQLLIGEEKTK